MLPSQETRGVQQWKLRMPTQAAAPKDVANSKLRRLLVYRKPFNCTVAQVGDSLLSYRALSRRSPPRWRGPAKILDIDDAGAPAQFRSPTS